MLGAHLEVQNEENRDPKVGPKLDLVLEGSKGSKRALLEGQEAEMGGLREAMGAPNH